MSLLAEVPDVAALAFLASAVAGRPVDVSTSPVGEAFTDGHTIFVHSGVGEDARRQVVVHAGLLRVGSLEAAGLGRVRWRRDVIQAFFSLEARRALHTLAPSLRGLDLAAWWPPPWPALTDGADRSLSLAAAGRSRIAPAPREWGTIRPSDVRVWRRPSERVGRSPRPDAGDTEPESAPEETAPDVAGRNPLARLLGRLGSAVRPGSADHRSAHLVAHGAVRLGGSVGAGPAVMSWSASRPGTSPTARAGCRYPEWDVFRSSYRPDWCQVAEVEVPASLLVATPGRVRDPWMRHELARVGLSRRPRRHEAVGDDLDLDALVESRVDARTGHRVDEDVYVGAALRRPDLSVLLLVDVSDSIGDRTGAGPPVHEGQLDVAGRLLDTLGALGVRVAAYGFHSDGRENVQLARCKDFDDPYDVHAQRRLFSTRPSGFSRLGAAIRHGTQRLERDGGTRWRLLVVVSDGVAFDDGYESRYGEADAARALDEVRERGLGCACITVGAVPESVQRVFGSVAHVADVELDRVRRRVPALLREAVRGRPLVDRAGSSALGARVAR
ncbi:MAG: nitric oxide reductase activation protein [Acidimicrobiia bacterium]|nr:nitric oxide reductase activation protein [Acidimicrobiia bacterium]